MISTPLSPQIQSRSASTLAIRLPLTLLLLSLSIFQTHCQTLAQSRTATPTSSQAPSFQLDILPTLTQAGCNSGACHGAAAGRGHFFLSLWGSNPSADYQQIVLAHQSRRVNFSSPADSLILAKPTGRIAHEGSELFDPNSPQAQLLEQWIAQGAPQGPPAQVTNLTIESQQVSPTTFLLSTFATLQDGRKFDVTDKTKWEVDPNGPIQLDDSPKPTNTIQANTHPPLRVSLEQPGRHVLVARFGAAFQAIALISPYDSTPNSPSTITNNAATNPIDRWINLGLEKANLSPAPTVDERTWLRRVTLDLTGKLPSLQDITRFESLPPETRFNSTIDHLLNSNDFNTYWTFQLARWLALRPLPNDQASTKAYESFLRDLMQQRRSWKHLAQELIQSTGPSDTNGAVNFARLTGDPRAHAEAVSRFFIGARLQCANCHNHPLDRWTQDDYHGLAAILAGIDRGKNVRYTPSVRVTNLRTNEPAIPRIPGMRDLPPHSDEKSVRENLQALSDWILGNDSLPTTTTNPSPTHPPFARAITNRLWASMMGRGLIDPIDDLRKTNPPSHPELLDALTKIFIQSDYHPEPVLRAIVSSQAYRRESYRTLANPKVDPSFYAVRIDKPLPPEVLYDGIQNAILNPDPNSNSSSTLPILERSPQALTWLDPTIPSESLDILGRCKRSVPCDTSSTNMGLSQQLHWINGPVVNKPLSAPNAFFHQAIAKGESNREILQQAYLRAFARPIPAEQSDHWLTQIPTDPADRKHWFEDWFWTLLSTSEFLLN